MTVSAPVLSFVARQPILDRRCRVRAYELLFRAGLENVFTGEHSAGSVSVIAHSSLLLDLQRLTGGCDAFINLTRDTLLGEAYSVLPAETTVLEILETIEPDGVVLEACRRARAAGYRVALDDVVEAERLAAFGDVVDLVKVDLLEAADGRCPEIEQLATELGIPLLAEKIETEEEFEKVRRRGYAFFQGYFLGRPKVMSTRDVPANKIALIELLRELNRPELDAQRLETLIKGDFALCYKLLRYINAVRFGLRNPIRSVRRAVILLGIDEMRRWASLAALATIADGRPPALIQQALTRARFYELLAPLHGLDDRVDDLFLTGILSMIDAVLQKPLDEVVSALPVEPEIKHALVDRTGALAPTHRFALAYELGQWQQASMESPANDEAAVTQAYVEAVEWADRHAAVATRHS